ncbi:hypothetical protein CLG96_04965 [Sphingomonas oleivorans]|uniref:Sodium:proline symporter n=1 Tax=Sphingomonas oleivorans TaxID=1735121 RepID=A0A2T5G2R4_9SPHN|nr:hypothetical protein [Sphingomonas oleivorans]PTQ13443.1 hypothetical protein CLG96_04965 [Sphingomonas oleivorans]
MTVLDWLVAGGVLALTLAVGVPRARRARGLDERFAAGRKLPWHLLGGSMAASSFSADTPLLVAGAVYLDGLAGNWFWWASAPGILATLFFFARSWRKSGVLTEIEIIRLRYGETRLATGFRVVKALLEGLVVNALVMASISYALALLGQSLLDRAAEAGVMAASVPALPLVMILFAATALYTAIAGFRGLVKADALQFGFAVIASFLLACFALAPLPDGLATLGTLHAPRGGTPLFDAWPQFEMPLLLLVGLGWWHSAPGNGMLVQRMVAARSDGDATLTVLWFALLHYLVRPWPWYLVGAAALLYFPALDRAEMAFPMMAARLLPPGALGLLGIGLLLAFVSSINSRLNFGASFIVNDVHRVLRPHTDVAGDRRIEQAALFLLTLVTLVIAFSGVLGGIRALYHYLMVIAAGTAFVSIVRWYWWRVTIVSEIASLASAILVGNLLALVGDIADPASFAWMLGANLVAGAAVTIVTAILGSRAGPLPDAIAFHRRTGVGGPGWRRLAADGGAPEEGSCLRHAILLWLLANILLFAAMLGTAAFFAGDVARLLACLAAFAGAAAFLYRKRRLLQRVLGLDPADAMMDVRRDPARKSGRWGVRRLHIPGIPILDRR